jgi:hypothetical protein
VPEEEPAPPSSRRPWIAVPLVAAAVVVALLAMARRPAVRERVVYVPRPAPAAPAAATPPAAHTPLVAAAPLASAGAPHATRVAPSRPGRAAAPPAHARPRLTPAPVINDCDGKDPLCGTLLRD